VISQALGGVGLFLIGMILVTDGLRAAAGDALRHFLLRFTGGRLKSIATGAVTTALVQSSSATTVATIGFVGAGLITFEQSIGLIFGANLGTTATGWMVAGFGLKANITQIALPLVGVGALLRLFTRGRAAQAGLALAGFGILFVGLDVLQSGMSSLSDRLTPERLPADTWTGRLLLVGLGVIITTVMQSSSAGVATALTALHTGAISLQQAAAMVIGINVGTTITASIAVIGASTAAKRTAFAHVLFNLITGAVAFATLPLFVMIIEQAGNSVTAGDHALLLAAFHTAFNLLGVLLLVPVIPRFAATVIRLVGHRGPELTRRLDPRIADQGSVATEAVRQTALDISHTLFGYLRQRLEPNGKSATDQLEAAAAALGETREYVDAIRFASPLSEESRARHVATVHALDHLGRFMSLASTAPPASEFDDVLGQFREVLDALMRWSHDPKAPAPLLETRRLADTALARRRSRRAETLQRAADGDLQLADADRRLDAMRWLEETTHFLWRLCDRLSGERLLSPEAV